MLEGGGFECKPIQPVISIDLADAPVNLEYQSEDGDGDEDVWP